MLKSKRIRKVFCAALAGISVIGSSAVFAGCTTKNPKVEMKLSFNGTTYTLEYKLYRKIAPATTTHFLELAENKYYDGLCVHNYTSTKLYTGGYTFDAAKSDEGGLVEKSYFEEVAGLSLTQTVWADAAREKPLNTVYGEFSANGFSVTNGSVKQSFGSLTMYYTPKSNCYTQVYVKRADGDGYDQRAYSFNSATSLFYISLDTSTTAANSSYCTFATLESGSKETLDDLVDAIDAYIDEEYDGDTAEFAPSTTLTVDEDDPYMSAAKEKATYSVPKSEIHVVSVRVKSY